MQTASILPNLIIAGIHKAGTSSIFTYLSLHPEVCASEIKEIGFFMPLKFNKPLPPFEDYLVHFRHCTPQKKYRMEASPSYMYGREKIAYTLKERLPGLKIIIILRNPVDRLISFYGHEYNNGFLPAGESFRDFVQKSIPYLQTPDIEKTDDNELYLRGMEEGMYIHYLPHWIKAFGSDLKIMFFEDLKKDTVSFMKEVCQWLDLDFSAYKPSDFTIDNKTTAYKSRVLHQLVYKAYMKTESFWRSHVRFKRYLRDCYKFIFSAKGNQSVSDEDYGYINNLYMEANRRLKDLLVAHHIQNLPEWLSDDYLR